MPSFRDIARERQSDFRNTSSTISANGRNPTDDKGQRHGHLLALGHEDENLYETLRGNQGAKHFFRQRAIKWWRDTNRTGDTRDGDGPTRNMASSQVACVNFLLPLRDFSGALLAILRALDTDVESVVDIKHDSNVSPVEFEWIGKGEPLERGAAPTRGANTTSVDAFMVAETAKGRRAYLLEWKYVEEYRRGAYLGAGRSGETRLKRYSDLYNSESSSFNGRVPITDLLYEPFYQLMRQRLLADRMVKLGELEVSEAKVIAVVPEGNKAYRERITSPPLAEKFPNLKSVSGMFRSTLKRPDDAYRIVCPSQLVDAVEQACGNATADWVKYQRERYRFQGQ